MTREEQRTQRQLVAIVRGTRQAKARLFLRSQSYMIPIIDGILRERQIEEGRPVRVTDFGVRLVYGPEHEPQGV